jgi:hypothetical protein
MLIWLPARKGNDFFVLANVLDIIEATSVGCLRTIYLFTVIRVDNLYSSPSIIRVIKSRRMRWAGHVARMGEKRNAYRILVGKPEGKRPLGRPRRRPVDNIKMNLREMG